MPASRIKHVDEEGNVTYTFGDPRRYPKKIKSKKAKATPVEREKPVEREPIERKGGGIALRGGGRAFYKGGKV